MNPRLWFGRLFERPSRFVLERPAVEDNLATFREFVVRLATDAGVPEDDLEKVKLAVDEACSNVVRHAYHDSGLTGPLRITVEVHSTRFVVRVHDRGKGFDPRISAAPDLAKYVESGRKGGLGVWLMRRLMDELSYASGPEGNELTLVKYFRPRAGRRTLAPRTSLRRRVMAWSLAVVTGIAAVAVTALLLDSGRRAETAVLRSYGAQVESLAFHSADPLAGRDDRALSALAQRARDASPELAYVAISDATGVVYGHSDVAQLFSTRPTVSGASVGTVGSARVVEGASPWGGGAVWEFSATIHRAGRPQGEAALAIGSGAIESERAALRRRIASIGALVWLLALGGTILLVQVLMRPVERLVGGLARQGEDGAPERLREMRQDEFGEIAEAFNSLVGRFEEAQAGLVEQERLEKEMQVAQQIQATLLPSSVPDVEGFDIGAGYLAAKAVGGDLYDFVPVDARTVGIVVADVSGKGVGGSMVMSVVRTAMRLESRGRQQPDDVLRRVNAFVSPDMKRGMFVTVAYLILDSRRRAIRYGSAGHNPVILYRARENRTYLLKPRGFPVGLQLPDPDLFGKSLASLTLKLAKDDVLVSYTDGITEAMSPSGELFGDHRLLDLIRQGARKSAQQIVDSIRAAVDAFAAGEPQADDITVVVVKEKTSVDALLAKHGRRIAELVSKGEMTLAQACRAEHLSPLAYQRWQRGIPAPGSARGRGGAARPMPVMAVEDRERILSVVEAAPGAGIAELRRQMGGRKAPPPSVIVAELRRLGLGTLPERKRFAAAQARRADRPEGLDEAESVAEDMPRGGEGESATTPSGTASD